jgi:hypothetical protein
MLGLLAGGALRNVPRSSSSNAFRFTLVVGNVQQSVEVTTAAPLLQASPVSTGIS